MRSPSQDDDRGSVTAEFVVVLPAVAVVLACCLGGMHLAAEQLRLQDAAAVAARTVARGGGLSSASARAAQLVPGATVRRADRGDLVCVQATGGGVVAGGVLGAVALQATTCALAGGQ